MATYELGGRDIHSPRLFAIEPQGSTSVGDGKTVLGNSCRICRNRLEVGINSNGGGSQSSAWVGKARLSDGLAEVYQRIVVSGKRVWLTWFPATLPDEQVNLSGSEMAIDSGLTIEKK